MFNLRQLLIRGLGLGAVWLTATTLIFNLASRPLFAQSTSDDPGRQSIAQVTQQFLTAAVDTTKVATAVGWARRADWAAGRFLRQQVPRFWERLKSRFVDPSGQIIWGHVIVLVVLLFLLWRLW